MRRIFFASIAYYLYMLTAMAQVDHDYNPKDVVPQASFTLQKDQVPQSVIKAASTDFSLKDPDTWSKFPYAIKEYGWVYDKDAVDVKPDRYEVQIKNSKGHDMSAVYSADGNLIATREEINDGTIPASVMASLANSKYKDWKVVGSREVIRYYHDKQSVEQHFRITVEKDNTKRSISFNYQADGDGTAKK